jgi:hypothetical protein
MAAGSRFGKGAATKTAPTAAAKKQPKPVQRVSKYANVEEQEDQDPMPVKGAYRLRYLGTEDNPSPKNKSVSWFRALFEIVEMDGAEAEAAHSVGDNVAVIQQSAGNGAPQGLPRIKSLIRHVAGYETEEEYDEYDPDALFIEACTGIANQYSEDAEAMKGRLVDVVVTRGREAPGKDDYYREYAWSIVPEDEQG